MLELIQARAAEGSQIVFPVRFLLDRHLAREPGERNIGLRAAQLLQRKLCDLILSGHGGRGGEYPVATDKIAALTDSLAR